MNSEFREIATDALRYWERGRIFYNLALVAATVSTAATNHIIQFLDTGSVAFSAVGLLVLIVLSNLLYCVVYPIDFFIQLSDFRESWRARRWLLLAAGTAFACVLAVFLVAFGLVPMYAPVDPMV